MKTVTNRFGTGELHELCDIKEYIYCECAACMSVYTDMASVVSCVEKRRGRWFTATPLNTPGLAIIVLGCQVTDLAILNDLRTAERLHEKCPESPIYMGGCLAQRFDIPLPEWLKRLDVARAEYQPLEFSQDGSYWTSYVHWQHPFWMSPAEDAEQSLFRTSYPLKIGAGCHGKCKYCTIRDTRGPSYSTDAYLQVKEFLDHKDVVLVADTIAASQIRDWVHIAMRYKKPVSFRNVEPATALEAFQDLSQLSSAGLLPVLHVPIQSGNTAILRDMGRDAMATISFVHEAQKLREYGTRLATNLIIDYPMDGKIHKNCDLHYMQMNFDSWVVNPYFDGKWDRAKAEERFKHYIRHTAS